MTPRPSCSIWRCAGAIEASSAASVIMRGIMISPLWHRALPLLLAVALSAADNDARDQLIRQLDQRAFGMLEQRAKTVAAITSEPICGESLGACVSSSP